MTIIERARSALGITTRSNALENPSVSLASPGIWAWLNNSEPTASGELVNDHTALQIATVFTCVKAISESVASLPLKLYEKTPNGKSEAVDNPLHTLLSVAPNPEMTAFSFWLAMVGSMALTGNAYAQIQRDDNDQPIALWPLNSRLTAPIRLGNGLLAYETSDGMANGQRRIIAAEDVFSAPMFSLDGIHGLSPIMQARQTLGLARAAEKYGSRFFGNGARPGGILSTPAKLEDKALQAARDTWQSAQGGANQGRTALLTGDWKYAPLGLSPEEGQFLETQDFTRQQIAALFRVPPHLAGDPSRLSDNNQQSSNLSFLQDCLSTYIHCIEAEVQRKLLSASYFVRFDTGERLRADLTQTMSAISMGRQWAILTTNEARGMLGLDPIGDELGGSTILQPVNMTILPSELTTQVQNAT
jgi:HK97 family phage portal protein